MQDLFWENQFNPKPHLTLFYTRGLNLVVVYVMVPQPNSAGSVTTHRIAFKYVMASEPYRYTWYLKQDMASLPYIKVYF